MAATEEHQRAQAVIKECHKALREQSKIVGVKRAWQQHVQNADKMKEYASAMHRLATIWDHNISREAATEKTQRSRVLWLRQYCTDYFYGAQPIYLLKRERERRLLRECTELQETPSNSSQLTAPPDPIRVLDVGSCFNPFAGTPHFKVTAIDLCPATADVLRGDFLQLQIVEGAEDVVCDANGENVISLPANDYHCVIFSLLLEYMPSAEQRLECCRRAYKLLQGEGILLIATPDSQHVGKNAHLMKNWRYTLATLGFMRVRFEKLQHIACMAFRKAIEPCVAKRWAEQHREPYMSDTIEIPQDNNNQS